MAYRVEEIPRQELDCYAFKQPENTPSSEPDQYPPSEDERVPGQDPGSAELWSHVQENPGEKCSGDIQAQSRSEGAWISSHDNGGEEDRSKSNVQMRQQIQV